MSLDQFKVKYKGQGGEAVRTEMIQFMKEQKQFMNDDENYYTSILDTNLVFIGNL